MLRLVAYGSAAAILIALGYVLRVLHVEYRVMHAIVRHTTDTRSEFMEAQKQALQTERLRLERLQATLSGRKGLHA